MNIDLIKVGATYDTKRASYYPDLGEQFDLLYHAINDGDFGEDAKTTDFYTELKAVKDKYPKP
jgi:hypothetical protein|tara:strand:- start:2303 stop:2491 length:189 start_codon:yes stop_codon:yes gene_type:complete